MIICCSPSPETLRSNLQALGRTCPALAQRLLSIPARQDASIFLADDGGVTGEIVGGSSSRALASKRRPLEEAKRFASRGELETHGAFAIAGFGAGAHVAALAKRLGGQGVILVFEPDLGLLRAVFESVDMSQWINGTNLLIVETADQPAALSAALRGFEGLVAMGLQIIDHPPSNARLGPHAPAFADTIARTVKALRTTIMTTLVQSPTTLRNLAMNAEHYATCPGIAELEGACRGRPAIVIAAGPSLAQAMEALARPEIREKFVLIAVQTVLKPLLERGIRPHFVTALDHHEISNRFYEGLSEEDLRGVTLIAEPMVNPGVLDAFCGAIRLVGDEHLDALLGEELAGVKGELRPGATVAHLSYEFARYLGCDPVLLVGQDLGFTDGQYYAGGAAIHDTWACELNEFRTLEMFEHERVVRQRHLLMRVPDQLGRTIYADEQMHSYQVQFEEMFARDHERGLRTIDCSEGGTLKRCAPPMAVDEALARFDTGVFAIPTDWTDERRGTSRREETIAALRSRIERIARDARSVAAASRRAGEWLRQMKKVQNNQKRVAQLIDKINVCRDEVTSLESAWELTQFLSQSEALERAKRDRIIALDRDSSALQQQLAQIERDLRNVTGLAESADRLAELMDRTLSALDGGPKLTRPPAADAVRVGCRRARVCAVVPVDLERGGLGNLRSIEEPLALGRSILQLTIERLAMCERLDRVILLSDEPERVRAIVRDCPGEIEIVHAQCERARRKSVSLGRVFAHASWRGGLAGLTVFDEILDPKLLHEVMQDLAIDAACLIGPDWCLVDPTLIDRLIERHREDPESHTFVFSQAAPGLGACVIARQLVGEIAAQIERAGPLASLGGVTGYIPDAGRADPIARDTCVRIHPSLRDLGARIIADSPSRASGIARVIEDHAGDLESLVGSQLGAALAEFAYREQRTPRQLTIELCTGRLTSGQRGSWQRSNREPDERPPTDLDLTARALTALSDAYPDAAVTFAGAGDPLQHPEFDQFIHLAEDAGVAGIHMRTDLLDERAVDRLLDTSVGIVSVDLLANDARTYAELTALDAFERVSANLNRLIEGRRARDGGPMAMPWIVPRLTRCDAVYEQLEGFYDHWISTLGACVIDPLPGRVAGERIGPLTVPRIARDRRTMEGLVLRSDGTVVLGGRKLGSIVEKSLLDIVRVPRSRARLVA